MERTPWVARLLPSCSPGRCPCFCPCQVHESIQGNIFLFLSKQLLFGAGSGQGSRAHLIVKEVGVPPHPRGGPVLCNLCWYEEEEMPTAALSTP